MHMHAATASTSAGTQAQRVPIRRAQVLGGTAENLFSHRAGMNSKITVLDGGMGHLLKGKGIKVAALDGKQFDKYFLVGCYANVEQPEVVQSLHKQFIEAGADVITTNNFAATPWALKSVGKEQDFVPLVEVLL